MAERPALICFAGDAWDGNPHSRHHLMRLLRRDYDVLFVEGLPMRGPMAGDRTELRRIWRKLRAPVGLRDWLHLGGRVWSGRAPAGGVLEVLQGRRVAVRPTPAQPVQYDGDLVPGARDLVAEVVPGGLRVRVPR